MSYHRQEQKLPPRRQVKAHEADGKDQVKVEPAEVGAHPGPPAEPVGIGSVGVQRGVDEVEAGAHLSDAPAPVPQRRGMPELVEDAGDEQYTEHYERETRRVEHLLHRTAHAVREVQPRVRESRDQ